LLTTMHISGPHPITLVCADAQGTVDSSTQVLGQPFITCPVNVDGPRLYHLSFGDDIDRPGAGS